MRYLDLFSGIGGFALGITETFEDSKKCSTDNTERTSQHGGCSLHNQSQSEVRRSEEGGNGTTQIEREGLHAGQQSAFSKHYFSEIDKYASRVYKRHFPDAIELGDIKNITGEGLGDIDLITFGFPCQDLSIAGNRKGLGGSRSGLFFEAIRLIRELKPQIFVFENVKGLFSSGGGRDFVEVLRTIADLRLYECEWQLLNTKWVLPQNRERIYFVGHLAGGSGRKVFPIRGDNEATDGLQGQSITNAIKARYEGGGDGSYVVESEQYAQTRKNSQGYRVRDTKGVSTTLAGQAGGVGAKTGLYAVRWQRTEKGKEMRKQNTGKDYTPFGDGCRELVEVEGDVGCITNAINKDCLLSECQRIRRLTPLECERLQGFPDGWTEGESDSQRYKMLGNAVSVPIVKMVFERIDLISGIGGDKR